MNFPFGQPKFAPLLKQLHAKELKVVLPNVIIEEVKKHALRRVGAAEDAHKRFRRAAANANLLLEPCVGEAAAQFSREKSETHVQSALTDFLEHSMVDTLPIQAGDADKVFENYFAGAPPFGPGKKKSEFPDAFAHMALERLARSLEHSIAIVSEDPDWHQACDASELFIRLESIDQVIELSQARERIQLDNIRSALEAYQENLEADILESFCDRGFTWESDAGIEDVEEIDEEEVKNFQVSIVGTENGQALLSGNV